MLKVYKKSYENAEQKNKFSSRRHKIQMDFVYVCWTSPGKDEAERMNKQKYTGYTCYEQARWLKYMVPGEG